MVTKKDGERVFVWCCPTLFCYCVNHNCQWLWFMCLRSAQTVLSLSIHRISQHWWPQYVLNRWYMKSKWEQKRVTNQYSYFIHGSRTLLFKNGWITLSSPALPVILPNVSFHKMFWDCFCSIFLLFFTWQDLLSPSFGHSRLHSGVRGGWGFKECHGVNLSNSTRHLFTKTIYIHSKSLHAACFVCHEFTLCGVWHMIVYIDLIWVWEFTPCDIKVL